MVNLELLRALQCAQGEEVVRKMVTSAKQGSQGGKERSKALWKFLHVEAFAPSQMSLITWASTKSTCMDFQLETIKKTLCC